MILFTRAVLLLCAGAGSLAAQVLSGSIVGAVIDPSGASVPSASVKATQTETNETRETVTNQTGEYTLPTLPPGHYSVSISHAGFGSFEATNIEVAYNAIVRQDAALEIRVQ